MKIAIDYDGTIMAYPEHYKMLMAALRSAGHEVGIVTGRPSATKFEDAKRIANMGIIYDFYYITDHNPPICLFNHVEEVMESAAQEADFVSRDDAVCLWKARLCVEENIDILFDDAADLILHFLPSNSPTLILKSPTVENRLLPKWKKNEYIQYK